MKIITSSHTKVTVKWTALWKMSIIIIIIIILYYAIYGSTQAHKYKKS